MNIVQQSRKRRTVGLTLTEILVALGVFGLVITGATSLFVISLKYYYYNSDKLQADRDLRAITDNITKAGTGASFFRVYNSFSDYTPVIAGSTGDLVVFGYSDPVANPAGDLVNRIVCFYQQSSADGKFPIRMYDSAADGASTLATTPVAYSTSILPGASTLGTNRLLAENLQDISNTVQLFYNLGGSSVVVNAKVFYKGTLRPNVSNTYNFAVTPRG